MTVYDFEATLIDGRTQSLADYRGKVLLIVNTASKCGFTPQYAGLQQLYQRYYDKGFEVLGFPCNQFGGQDPGADEEIQAFCDMQYQITFPMFSKIEVNGPGTHPLFAHLKSEAPGLLRMPAIKWNFTKFLIDRHGQVVTRFAPMVTPAQIAPKLERLLGP